MTLVGFWKSFDRDVRPILANHCWKCHGPDAKQRKAGLRLDQLDSATKPAESGKTAVIPNKPADSELMRRILSSDSDEQMPPASENKPLSAAQKEILKRWIEQAATFEQQLFRFQAEPAASKKLLSVGESSRNEQLPADELAAWAAVANVILNLDEAVTKG